MTITKLGHCCLLIEEKALHILTDPGDFAVEAQGTLRNIDVILITHEHADHLHLGSVKVLKQNNPDALIITNTSVGALLQEEGIDYQRVESGQKTNVHGVMIEGFGNEHAEIYHDYKRVQNTGYMIANYFFYPGDAFYNPGRPVTTLALPVAGPWLKVSEAIDYCIEVHPKTCFPVHDGMLNRTTPLYPLTKMFVEEKGVEFIALELGKTYEV